MESTIVELRHLSKIYLQGEVQVKAVDNVSLTIHRGDFATLCGPSGSGKTSILNLIGGLDTASSGQVMLEDVDLSTLTNTELSEIRKNRIGFVFQSYNLIPVMTAYENAAFVLDLQGTDKAKCRDRVMKTLADVGLQGLEHRRPDEMSGGQQQRVSIARVLTKKPTIIFADEPTGNLDNITAHEVMELFFEYIQKHNAGMILITHDDTLAHMCDKVYKLENKELVRVK